jgi:hypothetical protein
VIFVWDGRMRSGGLRGHRRTSNGYIVSIEAISRIKFQHPSNIQRPLSWSPVLLLRFPLGFILLLFRLPHLEVIKRPASSCDLGSGWRPLFGCIDPTSDAFIEPMDGLLLASLNLGAMDSPEKCQVLSYSIRLPAFASSCFIALKYLVAMLTCFFGCVV